MFLFKICSYADRCDSTDWDKASFKNLFAWNNGKGAVCSSCGGVQFENMLLVNNAETGIEGNLLKNANLYDSVSGPVYRVSY